MLTKICPKCNKEYSWRHNYCTKCGVDLENDVETEKLFEQKILDCFRREARAALTETPEY